jgi:hypothetical protein
MSAEVVLRKHSRDRKIGVTVQPPRGFMSLRPWGRATLTLLGVDHVWRTEGGRATALQAALVDLREAVRVVEVALIAEREAEQ